MQMAAPFAGGETADRPDQDSDLHPPHLVNFPVHRSGSVVVIELRPFHPDSFRADCHPRWNRLRSGRVCHLANPSCPRRRHGLPLRRPQAARSRRARR